VPLIGGLLESKGISKEAASIIVQAWRPGTQKQYDINHPLVTRYMQGVFVNRPALPRYKQIWDVSVVIKYLKSLGDTTQLSLQDPTMKTTMLLALVTGQRCQTIQALNIKHMVMHDDVWSFHINKLLKTSRLGKHFEMIEIKAFPSDQVICPITVLKEYVARTLPLRQNNCQLILSY
jgi:hypothetical protein